LKSWCIITADRGRGGRGVRGHVLGWFLRTHLGRGGAEILTPDEVRGRLTQDRQRRLAFLGFPSSFTPDELRALAARFDRLVPFDYLDQQQLAWTDGQRESLGPDAALYLKPWAEAPAIDGVGIGVLPLRTDPRFSLMLRLQRMRERLLPRRPPRYDVLFLGRPNQTRIWQDGQVVKLDQRVRWLMELKREAPDIRFFGGLTQLDGDEYADQQARYGDLSDLRFSRDRVSFTHYFRLLRQSRVLLTPGGNVPWTYRHYEAAYSGSMVVSNDFRQRRLLVPLPAGVIHVADDEPVLPAVRLALAMPAAEQADIAEANFAHLEQYLHYALHSRTRRATFEQFIAQLK
jgi:hypothetical protein